MAQYGTEALTGAVASYIAFKEVTHGIFFCFCMRHTEGSIFVTSLVRDAMLIAFLKRNFRRRRAKSTEI